MQLHHDTRTSATRLMPALVAALIAGTIAGADTITLRSSVRVPAGADVVTLQQVADLDGPHAATFAALPVARIDDPAAAIEIRITDIRRLLHEAGAHWGHINLNGRTVVVRTPGDGRIGPPQAMTALSVTEADDSPTHGRPKQPEPVSAADLVGRSTLRGHVAMTIARGLGRSPADVRLGFDARDDAMLDAPLDGRIFEISPRSSFHSDRIEMEIRGWTDGVVQQRHTISVQPLLRTEVATLRRDVARSEMIRASDLQRIEQWLAPGAAALVGNPVRIVGRIASKSLRAGDVIRANQFRAEMIVARGDPIMVRCLVGGVAITMTAEARADGGVGDAIACRKLGERSEFFATVTGPGEAVVDLTRRSQ